MKKIINIFIVTLIVSLPVQGIDLKAGAQLGIKEVNYLTDKNSSMTGESYDTMGAGIFADATYARIGLSYYQVTSFFNSEYKIKKKSGLFDTNGKERRFSDTKISLFTINAIAKYPFYFFNGKLSIWPGTGLEYDIVTIFEFSDKKRSRKYNEINDLYLAMATGADYFLTDKTAVTFSILAAYNLTPETSSRSRPGSGFHGYTLSGNIGMMKSF